MPANSGPAPTRATIVDVAQRAGVSTATVSRVINRQGHVLAGTAARVHAAIAELDYSPHLSARELAANRSHTLGLIMPEIGGHFFSAMLHGIDATAAAAGYSLLIYVARPHDTTAADFTPPLGERNADGLLVFASSLHEELLARLHAHRYPLVLLHRSPPPGLAIPAVRFENKSTMYSLVEHLIVVHGRRRIALLAGPPDHEDAQERAAGCCAALAAHHLAAEPLLIGPGLFEARRAEATVAGWLRSGVAFDAIVATDDESASGAMTALRAAGRRVPEDVAVVGFDDGLGARHLSPALTTVHAPSEEAGRAAATLLLGLIEQQARPQPAPPTGGITLLPTSPVIRQSCGCP